MPGMLNDDDVKAARQSLEAAKDYLKRGRIGPELPKPSHLELKRREKAVAQAEQRLLFIQQEAAKQKPELTS